MPSICIPISHLRAENLGSRGKKVPLPVGVKKTNYLPTEKLSMALLSWIQSLQGSRSHSSHGQEAAKGSADSHPHATLVLKRGDSVTADFFRSQGTVHTLCHVEQGDEVHFRLRVISELGKVSMIGLKVGTAGQFEANDRIFPFQVVRVALPMIDVTVFPAQARPVKRQFLRVPISGSVRLRPTGSTSPWITGRSLDLSAGGCGFAFSSSHLPALGVRYDLEMIVDISPQETEHLTMTAEVRWVKRVAGEVHVGAEVGNPAQRRALAAVVTRLQQSMSRRPGDYLLT
jgi:hypothetical protein